MTARQEAEKLELFFKISSEVSDIETSVSEGIKIN